MAMSWIKRMFGQKKDFSKPESKSMNADGSFAKQEDFERIWVAEKVKRKYEESISLSNKLSDNEYIDYRIWEDLHNEEMHKKHLPKTLVISGTNPNIIFHGGCLGCLSQRKHGIERCKGCYFFRSGGSRRDLFIKGEQAATMSQRDIDRILNRKKRD